jgi:hypothetical protein
VVGDVDGVQLGVMEGFSVCLVLGMAVGLEGAALGLDEGGKVFSAFG